MKLRVQFAEIEVHMRQIDAIEAVWTPNWVSRTHQREWEIETALTGAGLDVVIDDLVVGSDGIFTYQGHSVFIYISEQWKSKELLESDPFEGSKFHFLDCQTIKTMKTKNRFERYVAIKPKDKNFPISSREYDGSRIKFRGELICCRRCLRAINWKNISGSSDEAGSRQVAREFDIMEFFERYDSKFSVTPRRNAEEARDGYVDEWESISISYRSSVSWRCERCRVDLREAKNLLHCHHKNGVKSDNGRKNLMALCVLCHASEPGHRMHIKPKAELKLRDLRRRQGIRGV